MALTGKMGDFGISEILQLIGHQKKSGVLTVRDKTRKVEILFDQGNIVGTRHEPFGEAFDLGSMLKRSGLISGSQLEAGRKEQAASLKPLEQILLSARAVDHAELKAMVTLSHLETVWSLFLWKDGDYSFEPGPVTYPKQWTDPISSEQVLMDGYRIKDEWPQIEAAVPDLLARLEKVSGEYGPEARLSPDQRRVYNLVDGSRTVEDMAFLSRMGRFETLKVIGDLIANGRVETIETEAGKESVNLAGTLYQVAGLLVLVLGLVGLAAGLVRNGQRMLAPGLAAPGIEAQEMLWAWYREDRVRAAVSLYAAMKGLYPESVNRLVEDGELDASDLATRWGPLEYYVDEGGRSCRIQVPGSPASASTSEAPPGG